MLGKLKEGQFFRTTDSEGNPVLWRFSEDDASIANKTFEKVLEAIKEQDSAALKSLFSKKALSEAENIDESISELFDLFKGSFVSYDDWGGPGVDGLYEMRKMNSTYDVKTDQGEYRFCLIQYTRDSQHRKNVGIQTLWAVSAEDTDTQIAYRKYEDAFGIIVEKPKE